MKKTPNKPDNYVAVRCQLVHIRKRFHFFLKDEKLAFSIVIPNTIEEAFELFKDIDKLSKKYGKDILGES